MGILNWLKNLRGTPEDRAYKAELKERDKRQVGLGGIVEASINQVMREFSDREPHPVRHYFYGASAIDPRHLAIHYAFYTVSEWKEAERNGVAAEMFNRTREILKEKGYPAQAIPLISIDSVAHETVEKEAGGNYYQYYK